jgi:hypothetical protein
MILYEGLEISKESKRRESIRDPASIMVKKLCDFVTAIEEASEHQDNCVLYATDVATIRERQICTSISETGANVK